MNKRTYTVTFIFVIFACIFIIIMAKQLVNPIKHLSNVMKIVEKGDFDIKASIDGDDEIGHLAKTFNIMTDRIKGLINEVYIDKIKQKDLELQRLQTQINPHFLYKRYDHHHD